MLLCGSLGNACPYDSVVGRRHPADPRDTWSSATNGGGLDHINPVGTSPLQLGETARLRDSAALPNFRFSVAAVHYVLLIVDWRENEVRN